MKTQKIKLFLRSLLYSFIIICSIYLVSLSKTIKWLPPEVFIFLVFVIILLELFFSIVLIYKENLNNSNNKFSIIEASEKFLIHNAYTFITTLSLILYCAYFNDILIYVLLATFGVVHSIYLYYLKFHVLYSILDLNADKKIKIQDAKFNNIVDLLKSHKERIYHKFDFILFVLKFFSYSVSNLVLLSYFSSKILSFELYLFLNFTINIIFYFLHLVRRNFIDSSHLTVIFVLSLIITFFNFITPFVSIKVNLGYSILYFYLSFAIYFHHENRTFTSKIFAEYLILSTLIAYFLLIL